MTPGRLGFADKSLLKFIHLGLIFVVLCCGSQLCFAQLDRGGISGVVTDSSGAVVAGARVTVTNTAMGTQNSTVSTGAGGYTVPQLPAGEYYVTVVATGFSQLIRNGITVSVGQTATIDLKLTVGQATTTVTVTANAPLLQTDSPQNNVEVTTRDMNELPINITGIGAVRDPMGFAALVPGTIAAGGIISTSAARRQPRTVSLWTGWTTPRRSRAPSPMRTSPRSSRSAQNP